MKEEYIVLATNWGGNYVMKNMTGNPACRGKDVKIKHSQVDKEKLALAKGVI